MKAAVLTAFGKPLEVREVPDPVLGTGEVLLDVVSTHLLPYTDEVLSGARGYQLTLPVIPGVGAIGRVAALGPDATRLRPGDWIMVDPTLRSRDDALTPDIMLQGWSARGAGGLALGRYYGNGSFASRMLVPTENAVPLGDIADSGPWHGLGLCLVPYGGFLAAELQPGETVLVSGATGNYGSAAVLTALAMGAGRVVAPGRNGSMLAELARRFGPRVATVEISGVDQDADRAAMLAAAPGPVDVVLDLLPPGAAVGAVRAAAMTVREYGRVVLMGGIAEPVDLPYRWLMRNSVTLRGQWMYPRTAVGRLIALARAGLLDLSQFSVTTFGLDSVSEAIAHAAAEGGRFSLTVLRP